MNTPQKSWRTPQNFLLLISIIVPIAFSTWMALLNNFVIEKANFDGADIGLLQSVREIPGFLAFTVVFVLLFIREQRFMLVSLAMLTLGTAITGYFPSLFGLLFTTLLMSTGFHYFETLKQSLSLQWLSKEEAPEMLGKFISVGALASLVTYGAIWVLLEQLKLDFKTVYLLAGGTGFILIMVMAFAFPEFKTEVPQNKKLVLRKRYWLYYALTFMSGARRQIFTVFAGFLMVEKFGYSAADITLLFLINYLFNFLFAKRIGRFIGAVGERKALMFEYVGLIFVFVGYGLVQTAEWAAALYVIDHLFFCAGTRNQNLLPEDCRSGGHGINCWCGVYHQPYCCCRDSGNLWCDLVGFAFKCVLHWCRYGRSELVTVFKYPSQAGRG